jgi:chaperonin cofactor prefoldin
MHELAASGKQPQDTAADDALLHALHHTHTEATRLFLMATRQGATDAQIADALRQGVPHITDPGTRCDNLEKENSIKKLMAEIDSVRQDLVLKDKAIKDLIDQHDDLLEALTVAQRQSIDALLARDEALNAKHDALHARDRIEMELSSCLQVLIELQSSGHANELIDEENALHKQVTCILGPKLDGHDVAVAALKKRHNTLKAEIQRLPLLSGHTLPPCTPPVCSAPDPIRSADQEGLRNNIESLKTAPNCAGWLRLPRKEWDF